MSDTANRGKILWVMATSRPDLLEVDLKRQGRLDVHIPLFPPGDPESRHELFYAMARKVGLDMTPEELPTLPDNDQIGGNEMEGILVRALRLYETQAARLSDGPGDGPGDSPDGGEPAAERALPEIIAEVIADVRPSAHVERLMLMDLVAVKECTDSRFLPARYASLSLSDVNRRIEQLRLLLGE
jgi:SpoVK/Ycf46/Vps4 family AAA+-type ATPase